MVSTANELASLFRRDLARLSKQIEAFPNDDALWQTVPGVLNAAGNLALHIEGNLREYVGRQLGNLPYQRNRELEFSSKGLSRDELSARLAELRQSIPAVIAELSAEQMEMEYPEVVLEVATYHTGIPNSSLWTPELASRPGGLSASYLESLNQRSLCRGLFYKTLAEAAAKMRLTFPRRKTPRATSRRR